MVGEAEARATLVNILLRPQKIFPRIPAASAAKGMTAAADADAPAPALGAFV